MSLILICEAIGFPGVVWLLMVWRKRGELTVNRFALIVVAYLSLVTGTVFQLYSKTFEVRIIGDILSILVLFPGYFITRWIYGRVIRH